MGPVAVHTGGTGSSPRSCAADSSGRCSQATPLAWHDVEARAVGTSLGVDLEAGARSRKATAITCARSTSSIAPAGHPQRWRQRVLKSGIMYELVTHGVEYVLAGSIRDDGPLVDTLMDLIDAQNRYPRCLTDGEAREMSRRCCMASAWEHAAVVGRWRVWIIKIRR